MTKPLSKDWSLRGGIVGRGVLIDYHTWAKNNNIHHPAFERTCISTVEIEEIAKTQGVELRPADILIIRTGWTEWYNGASAVKRNAGTTGDKHIGLEGTEDTVKWLWNKHFSAVASDTLAFEAWPTKPPFSMGHGSLETWIWANDWIGLHDWLLAMWGCPIGELWDLETLAKKCQLYKKWSFFIASAPLNVIGGVASPPNAVAIL
jgi:kynurenine formamidase